MNDRWLTEDKYELPEEFLLLTTSEEFINMS